MNGKLVKLKDVVNWVRGLTYSKNDEVESDGIPVLRATNINLATHKIILDEIRFINKSVKIKKEKYVKKGDILICTASGSKIHLGKVALVEQNLSMAFGGFMAVLRCTKDCNSEFLYYLLTSPKFKKHLTSLSDGANINNLKFSQIEGYEFFLPSIIEQQRIVAKLNTALGNINTIIKKNKNNLEQTKILFQNIIDLNLNFPNYPCVEIELKKLITIKHGFAFQSKNFSRSNSTNLPVVLTPGNFSENAELYFTDKNTKRIHTKVNKELFFSKGDLVIVMTDLSAKMDLLGKPAFIKNENILHNQRIGLVKNDELKVLNDYLYFYFMSKSYLTNIKKTASGTMVRHTAPKRILDNKINIPILLNHQKEIVEKISLARLQIKKYKLYKDEKITLLENLRNKIFIQEMQKENKVA